MGKFQDNFLFFYLYFNRGFQICIVTEKKCIKDWRNIEKIMLFHDKKNTFPVALYSCVCVYPYSLLILLEYC